MGSEPSTGRQVGVSMALLVIDLMVIAWLLFRYGMAGWADGYDPGNPPDAPGEALRGRGSWPAARSSRAVVSCTSGGAFPASCNWWSWEPERVCWPSSPPLSRGCRAGSPLAHAPLPKRHEEAPPKEISAGALPWWAAVAGAGVEPATFRFSGGRSYQLSYPATQPRGCSGPDGI